MIDKKELTKIQDKMTEAKEDKTMKTFRVIPFPATIEAWPMWSKRFLVMATKRGYKNKIDGSVTVPTFDQCPRMIRLQILSQCASP